MFHDGIYMERSQLSRAPFLDLKRVEVLRGTQSVLFGKNTIGGAIHVISAKPTQELEGMVSGLYGWDDGEREITAVLSGPITDTLSGRIAYSDETTAAGDLDAGDLDPGYTGQDSNTKYDLRLSLGSQEGDWDVALIGKNLTNEYTSSNSDDQPLVPGNGFASTDRLRSYALQATYRF